jgi:hypothetical protein
MAKPDFHFGAWVAIADEIRSELHKLSIKTPQLTRAAETFKSNAQHAADVSDIAFEFVQSGMKMARAQIAASLMTHGKVIRINGPVVGDVLNKQKDAQKLYRQILKKEIDTPYKDFVHQYGITTADVITNMDASTDKMLETLMASQIILMWSAFETLARDLWKAALNCHPVTLAELSGTLAQPHSRGTKRKRGNPDKTIELSVIVGHEYKLGKRMGTILAVKYKFDKMDDIIRAYRAAFPNTCKLNEKAFWANRSLRAMCAMRNVIVHRRGLIDSKFLYQRGDEPSLAHYQRRQALTLDGVMLQSILKGFVVFCVQIFQEADNWIVSNP